jgi:hypothetical protein
MSFWRGPEGRARIEHALSMFETFVILSFEDGDLDGLDHDDQYSKVLESAELDCEVDILPATESLRVFDAIRIRLGCATPPNAKHSRILDSDDDSESSMSQCDLSDSSEDDVVDDVVGDVILHLTVPQRTGRLVYKPETLVSFIPNLPEFDGLKRSIGVLRTSSRFLPGMSNRRGRAILHKKGHDLKTWPRIEHREVLPYPLRDSVPFGGKPIRVLGLVRDNKVVKQVTTGDYLSATRFLKREERSVSKLKYDPVRGVYRRLAVVNKETINVVGGQAYPRKKWITGFINPEHKKYWYFLRRNGMAYHSVHHPYDDEDMT